MVMYAPEGGRAMLNRINIIRAISCSLIAIFHTTKFLNANAASLQIPFPISAPGFHLFLLISGIVLFYTTREGDRPLSFMARRVTRLAPLYWLMTAIAIALVLWRPWILPFANLSPESIVRSFLFIPFDDAAATLRPVLFVGWTLNYIMVFYALFALSLLAPRRFQAVVVIACLIALMLAAPAFPDDAARRFYSRPILLEFATGVLIGHLLATKQAAAWVKTHSMTALLVVGLIGMFANALAHLAPLWNVTVYCVAGAMVVFAMAGEDLYGKRLTSPLLIHAGAISFAVLLVHPLIIPIIGEPLVSRIHNDALSAAILIPAVLIVSFIAAHLAHIYLEKPVNQRLRALFKASGGRPVLEAPAPPQ